MNRPIASPRAALLLTGALLAMPLAAIANPKHDEVFQDWRTHCETLEGATAESCHVFQNLVARDTQQQVLHAMVLYTPKRADPVMILTLPLGVALRAGVEVTVDAGNPHKLIYEACTPVGCRAGLLLAAATLAEFQKGSKATIGFFNLRGNPLKVPLSLSGFTKAVKSLK